MADVDFFLLFNRTRVLYLAFFCGEHGIFKGGEGEMKGEVNEW